MFRRHHARHGAYVQTLVTTARTIDQERWEVSALRFPSWILDNRLLVAFSITAFY
jgi:hypothetical protein